KSFFLGAPRESFNSDILWQKVLQVMLRRIGAEGQGLRLEMALTAADERIAGENFAEEVVRVREAEFDRSLVDLDHFARLAVNRHLGDWNRNYRLLAVEIFEPEYEIIRGEWRAIRPPHA